MVSNNKVYCACSTLFSVLRLGLISFIESHASESFLDWTGSVHYFDNISVSTTIEFHKRDLACLHDYIGVPVWMFGPPSIDTGAYRVSIGLDMFTDLWGSVWAVSNEQFPPDFEEFYTEGGALLRSSAPLDIPLYEGEVSCHWTAKTSLEAREKIKSPQDRRCYSSGPGLTTWSRMLIGTEEGLLAQPHEESDPFRGLSQMRPKDFPGFSVNGSCPTNHNLVSLKRRMALPGTYRSTYEPDSFTLSATSGYKFTFGISRGWKLRPASTLKTRLLKIFNETRGKLIPLLKARVGLEISRCSINARRVNLWEALTLAHFGKNRDGKQISPTSSPCSHAVGQIACIAECWGLSGALARAGVHFTQDMLVDVANGDSSEVFESKSKVRELIMDAVMELEQTGVDQTNALQAFYPYAESPTVICLNIDGKLVREANRWIPMVKESPSSACFAVISDSCLVSPLSGLYHMPTYGKCLMDPSVGKEKRFTILHTTFYSWRAKNESTKHASDNELENHPVIPVGEDLLLEKIGILRPVKQSGLVLELECGMRKFLKRPRTEVKELIFDEHGTDARASFFIV